MVGDGARAGGGWTPGQSVRHRSKPRACELRSVRDLNGGSPAAGRNPPAPAAGVSLAATYSPCSNANLSWASTAFTR
jgi:hypothetical protein